MYLFKLLWWRLRVKNNHFGFVPPKIIKRGDKKDWLMGDNNLSAEVLQENGQWDDFLPVYEAQSNQYFDTMHCFVYGTLNCLETLLKRKYGYEDNYSERFTGVRSGASTNGGSPHNASESIRKDGVIPQKDLDFTSDIRTWWQFSSPRPMTVSLLAKGQEWLKTHSYSHDWVSNPVSFLNRWNKNYRSSVIDGMKEALKYSPLGVSVNAWKKRKNIVNGQEMELYYKNVGDVDNHWLECFGGVEPLYWNVYDHYDQTFKKLEWNYPFGYIKRYTVADLEVNLTPQDLTDKYFAKNVKGGDKATPVYYIFDGKKRGYPDRLTFDSYPDFTDADIIKIPSKYLDMISDGLPMPIYGQTSAFINRVKNDPPAKKKLIEIISK